MTLLLAIDSACAACSTAILKDGDILSSCFEEMGLGQSEKLIPFVEQVLVEAQIEINEIDALAVSTGPGAFTGIRICLSAARAMSLALKKPLIGIPTTETLFASQTILNMDIKYTVVLMETKRQDFYIQSFSKAGESLMSVSALLGNDIYQIIKSYAAEGKILICGDGADRFIQQFQSNMSNDKITEQIIFDNTAPTQPRAEILAKLAYEKFKTASEGEYNIPPQPIYLRPPDAIPPKPKFKFRAAGES